jgi:hypothetical protein
MRGSKGGDDGREISSYAGNEGGEDGNGRDWGPLRWRVEDDGGRQASDVCIPFCSVLSPGHGYGYLTGIVRLLYHDQPSKTWD